MLRNVAVFLALLTSTAQASDNRPATDKELVAVRAALATKLKDSDSAKLLAVQVGADGETVCGLVNGKNAFGAYAGPVPFFGKVYAPSKGGLDKTTAIVLSVGESVSRLACEQAGIYLPK